jgi:hypothetical protein
MSLGHDILSVARLPVPPLALLPAVETAMGGLKAVTVRAENPKILDAMIRPITVDVIKFERQPTIGRTLSPPAEFASALLECGPDQSLPQLVALKCAPGHENRAQRQGWTSVALPTLVPGSPSKMARGNPKLLESNLNLPVVPALWHEPQGHECLPYARR